MDKAQEQQRERDADRVIRIMQRERPRALTIEYVAAGTAIGETEVLEALRLLERQKRVRRVAQHGGGRPGYSVYELTAAVAPVAYDWS